MSVVLTEEQMIERAVVLSKRYLGPRGWFHSLALGPIDSNYQSVPWYTYPAFEFISKLVKPDFRVFEFGCGRSSLWWASKVAEVVAVESDRGWAEGVREEAPPNLKVILKEKGDPHAPEFDELVQEFLAFAKDFPRTGIVEQDDRHGFDLENFTGYATEILRWPEGTFDVVVVDGMARNMCAWLAATMVKPTGFVVFDNSDRWRYAPGMAMLQELGFARIDFHGPGPVNTYAWCTSVFVRDLDLLRRVPQPPVGSGDVP